MFLKKFGLLVKLLINYQMVSLEQMHIMFLNLSNNHSHPGTRRRSDVVTTSLCTSQRRRRYVSNEIPNDVSMKRCQDISMVRLHNVLLERRDDVSRWGKNNTPSVRLLDVSNKSQMKHPMTSQWYVTKLSQWYVSTTSH